MSAEPTQPTPPLHEAWTVQERVSVGTAGVVYRALQASTGQEVTFKVLTPKSTHPLEPARVLAMRWRLEALQHPVIAGLIDAYEDPEGFVIVTTWMGGGIGGNEFPRKRSTLTKQEARLVAMRLCGALLVGEQQRFPHGDLKPSNVILADRGPQGLEVQIQDWGLSSCREEQPQETHQFMAPERHHGHPASTQGDLFSAAATLWYLITGEAPAYGSTPQEVLQDWGSFKAASLAQLRPDLDDHFRQWLAWLLRWQPGDRPQSISQALDVLGEVVSYAAALEAQPKKGEAPAPSGEAASPASAPSRTTPALAPGTSQPATAASVTPAAATPTPPKTAGPRPAAPKLHLPVAPTAPPPSDASTATRAEKPPKEKVNPGQRIMAFVIALCLLAAVGIAFVAWAENRYGQDWKDKLSAHWSSMFASKPPTVTQTAPPAPTPPESPPSKAGLTGKSSGKSAPSLAKPSTGSATKPPPKTNAPKLIAIDRLDGTGDLQGRSQGTGWKGPWQAQSVPIENNLALFGKGSASTATRPLGTLKNLPDDFIVVSFTVIHPGKDAAPLKLDLLSPDGKTPVAPACVAFEDGKVRVYFEGSEQKLDAPVGKPFHWSVRWDWKSKKSGGKREVNLSMHVDLTARAVDSKKYPAAKRTLPEHALPTNFVLLLHSNGAPQPVSITDLRVSRYLRDALP